MNVGAHTGDNASECTILCVACCVHDAAPMRSILITLLTVAGACTADTYTVSIDSSEVREGALAIQLDATGEVPVLRAVLGLNADDSGACPVLRDDAKLVLERDGVRTELQVDSRGGGISTVDCAIKCHELVAFESVCTPVTASVHGAELLTLDAARNAKLFVEDATASLAMTLEGETLEPRSVELPGGAEILVTPNLETEYRFTRVPFLWSHPDTDHWVGEQTEDEFPAFNLAAADGEGLAFSIRGDVSPGRHAVYFGASAPAASCDFGTCKGIERLVKQELEIRYP